MLIDDLLADRFLPVVYQGYDTVQKSLKAAQKFALASDFALAADGLVENISELVKVAPFCRLPYPITWIEFAHRDRKHWSDAPMHYPELQHAPHRVGFLCEAEDDSLGRFKVTLHWSLKDFETTAQNRNNASMMAVRYDVLRPGVKLTDWIDLTLAPFGMDIQGEAAKAFGHLLRSDWAGEIRYLFAVLGLLNARNATESELRDNTKFNAKRLKHGKAPLASHTVLKIRPAHKPSLIGARSATARSNEIRGHFVRGHFKTRATGVFWWGPHMRGRLSRGFVDKDYEVAG